MVFDQRYRRDQWSDFYRLNIIGLRKEKKTTIRLSPEKDVGVGARVLVKAVLYYLQKKKKHIFIAEKLPIIRILLEARALSRRRRYADDKRTADEEKVIGNGVFWKQILTRCRRDRVSFSVVDCRDRRETLSISYYIRISSVHNSKKQNSHSYIDGYTISISIFFSLRVYVYNKRLPSFLSNTRRARARYWRQNDFANLTVGINDLPQHRYTVAGNLRNESM